MRCEVLSSEQCLSLQSVLEEYTECCASGRIAVGLYSASQPLSSHLRTPFIQTELQFRSALCFFIQCKGDLQHIQVIFHPKIKRKKREKKNDF